MEGTARCIILKHVCLHILRFNDPGARQIHIVRSNKRELDLYSCELRHCWLLVHEAAHNTAPPNNNRRHEALSADMNETVVQLRRTWRHRDWSITLWFE